MKFKQIINETVFPIMGAISIGTYTAFGQNYFKELVDPRQGRVTESILMEQTTQLDTSSIIYRNLLDVLEKIRDSM